MRALEEIRNWIAHRAFEYTIVGLAPVVFLSACSGGAADVAPAITQIPATNVAPVVSNANSNQTAIEGVSFSYDATQGGSTFSDANNDALSYSVSFSPDPQGLNSDGGVISGTPSLTGAVTVTIEASDSDGEIATDSFQIGILENTPLTRKFGAAIDLSSLANYEGQTVPSYITRTNNSQQVTNEAATLGRVLFYDTLLSTTGEIACASCHVQDEGFSDGNVVSTGVDGGTTGRHSMRLVNSSTEPIATFFWDRRAASLEDQVTAPLKSRDEHGFSGGTQPEFDELLAKIAGEDYYQELFTFVYGDSAVTEERLQIALSQFVHAMESFDSKYDLGRAQVSNDQVDFPNFTNAENDGKSFFMGDGNCNVCHTAPTFQMSRNNGHIGVVGVAGNPNGVDFTNTRAPSLRNIFQPDGTENGPFMHDGSFDTLADAIEHYDDIGPPNGVSNADFFANLDPNVRNLDVSNGDRNDLVAFLRTLSGTEIYTDEKFSDPFRE